MADANVNALMAWGRGLVQTAASAGMPVQDLPESGELKDFVAWAQAVTAGIGGMLPLPALAADADYGAALSWASALDGAARGMGAALPPLPA